MRETPSKVNWRIFAALFIVFPRIVDATQIIVVVDREGVVLSADSLVVNPGGPSFKECKIHRHADYFWAIGGLSRNRKTGFDTNKLINNHLGELLKDGAPKRSLRELLDSTEPELTAALNKELPIIAQETPDIYEKIRKNGFILSVFMVHAKNGHVCALNKDFNVQDGRVLPTKAKTCHNERGGTRCLLVTKSKALADYVAKPGSMNGEMRTVIDRLMNVAKDTDPVDVGPPYTILAVPAKGKATWVRQNDCQSIE